MPRCRCATLLDGRSHRSPSASTSGFRSALDQLDFTEIFTPKVVAAATESGANVFPIDWFGRRAFLAQSPQFYKQMMVGVFERVYEVGPVFRAEPHDTVRHLAEYVSLDAELGFIEDHRDVMAVLRVALAGMSDALGDRAGPALELLGIDPPAVPATIPALDFREAQLLIEADTGRPTVGEPDLAPADERWLGAWALREHHSEFLFITGYPMAKRPFYTHPDPSDPSVSNGFDLLYRGLELVTGGQRLHHHDGLPAGPRRSGPRPARGLPRGLPPRDASARRVRHRARALGRPADRRRQRS